MAVNPRSNGIIASPLNDLKFSTSNAFRYFPFPLNQSTETPTLNQEGGKGGLEGYEARARESAFLGVT